MWSTSGHRAMQAVDLINPELGWASALIDARSGVFSVTAGIVADMKLVRSSQKAIIRNQHQITGIKLFPCSVNKSFLN